MKRLILGGGGDAPDSKPLDQLLLDMIPKGKQMLYIPIAWKGENFDGCYAWIKGTFGALGFQDIVMWTNLKGKTYEDIKSFGAIYIGGGNTFTLLDKMRKTKFLTALKKYIERGNTVYGGSAGAIILGRDIRTASFGGDADANDARVRNFHGLNLLKDFTVQCHYKQEQDREITDFVQKTGLVVIALPERSGLYVEDKHIQVKGFEPAVLFKKDRKLFKKPGTGIK